MAGSGAILSLPLSVTDSNRDPDNPLKNRRYSAWRVLINTNVSRKSISRDHFQRIVHRLNEAWEQMFGPTPANIRTFIPFDEAHFPFLAAPNNPYVRWKTPSNPSFPPPAASSRKKGEIGRKFHKIHLHGEFRIIHYGNVRLDYNELKRTMKELIVGEGNDLGIANPYITFEYVVDRDGDEIYLEKGEEIHRDQTDNEIRQIVDVEQAEEAARNRAASNSTSSGLRPQDLENDDYLLTQDDVFDNDFDSDEEEIPLVNQHHHHPNDDDLLPVLEEVEIPPQRRQRRPRRPPIDPVELGEYRIGGLRSIEGRTREYGGEVMPRSEYRSRRRRGRGKK